MKDWRTVSEEIVGDYDVFKVRRLTLSPPDTNDEFPFHVVDIPDSVITIALTEDDRVVLVEQFRQGIRDASLEFPAGIVDDGEEAAAAGLRELKEETGYVTGRHEVIGRIASDPALNSSYITVVAAFDCRRQAAQDLDETERIEPRVVAREEIDGLIVSGRIRHSNAIAAWYLFSRYAVSSGRRP